MSLKLLMLRGLPASGKTTLARGLAMTGTWFRVNKDDIREYLTSSETRVERIAMEQAEEALRRGHNVVWDNTSLHPSNESKLRELAKKHDAKFITRLLDIDPAEAVRRDLLRARSVGSEVIFSMYNRYLRKD